MWGSSYPNTPLGFECIDQKSHGPNLLPILLVEFFHWWSGQGIPKAPNNTILNEKTSIPILPNKWKDFFILAETLENSCPARMTEAMTVEGEEGSMMTQDFQERTSIPWHTSAQ